MENEGRQSENEGRQSENEEEEEGREKPVSVLQFIWSFIRERQTEMKRKTDRINERGEKNKSNQGIFKKKKRYT